MKNIITIVLFFQILLAGAQPSLDIFKDYTPKWIHGTFDTTALDLVGYQDYSKMRYLVSLMDAGNIYTMYQYNLQNRYNDGGYIESIDLETGEERWRKFYDLRSIDVNEKPNDMRLNKSGELEIVGERFLERRTGFSRTNFNTLVIRKYDSESGELIIWNITDPNDSLNTRLGFNEVNRSLYFYEEDKYQYILIGSMNFFNYLPTFIIDTSGYKIRKDTAFWNNDFIFQKFEEMQLINDSTMVTTLLSYIDIAIGFQYELKVYDRNMKEVINLDLTKDFADMRRDNTIHLAFADEKYFVIYYRNNHSNQYWSANYYIYDYEGNRLDSVDLYKNNLGYSNIKRISADELLLIGQDSRDITEDFSLHFYRKKIGGDMVLLRKIEMATPDRFLYPQKIHLTETNDIVIVGGYYIIDFVSLTALQWFPVTICFSAEDIDITGTSDQIVQVPELIIHPNPAAHSITISHGYKGEARIEVLDVMGRVVIGKTAMSAGEDELAVSVLNAGVYVVRVLDRRGVVMGRGKFVRR